MKTFARHLILLPAASIVFVYPMVRALDWAMGEPAFGSLGSMLHDLYGEASPV